MAYPAGLTRLHFIPSREALHHHRKFKRDKKKRAASRKQQTHRVTTPPRSDPGTSPSTPRRPVAAFSTTTPPRSALRTASTSTSSSSSRSVTFHPSTKTTVGRVGNRLPRRGSTITSIAEDRIDNITPHAAEARDGGQASGLANGHRVQPAVDVMHNESKWHRYAGKVLDVLSFSSQRACLEDMAKKRKEEKRRKEQVKRQKQRNESLQILARSGWNVKECSVQPTYCREKN